MKKELSLQHGNPQVGGLVTGSKQNWAFVCKLNGFTTCVYLDLFSE